MRKLTIAFAIVCTVALAHAGCYTWGLTSGDDRNCTGAYLTEVQFTAMLFTGTIGEKSNGNGTYTLDFSQANYITQTSAFDGTYYTIGDLMFDPGRKDPAVTGGNKQPYAILVLDTGAGITDYAKYEGTYAIMAGEGSVNQDKESEINYSVFQTGEAVVGSMYHTAASGTPEPVPEPTSGLLLILGVASMALRRRRV